MKKRLVAPGIVLGVGLMAAGCTGGSQTPLSPSSGTGGDTAAAADGSTLKVTAPALISPENTTRIDSRRPVLVWTNSVGKYAGVGVAYEIEVARVSDNAVVYTTIVGETPGISQHAVPVDGAYDTEYRWRVRARLEAAVGPWSAAWTFRTVQQFGPSTGTVGPPRTIPVDEAVSIIRAVYTAGNYNIGASSTRDERNLYLEIAMATIHYGHPVWNPRGPDNNWCIKNGGPGRPQADDVIVICSTRDAWDLVVSIGANNYSWHTDYIGRLPGEQAVYAPSSSVLALAPQPR